MLYEVITFETGDGCGVGDGNQMFHELREGVLVSVLGILLQKLKIVHHTLHYPRGIAKPNKKDAYPVFLLHIL